MLTIPVSGDEYIKTGSKWTDESYLANFITFIMIKLVQKPGESSIAILECLWRGCEWQYNFVSTKEVPTPTANFMSQLLADRKSVV